MGGSKAAPIGSARGAGTALCTCGNGTRGHGSRQRRRGPGELVDTGAPAWHDLSLHRPAEASRRRLGFGARTESLGGGGASSASPTSARGALRGSDTYGVEDRCLHRGDDSLCCCKVIEGLLPGLHDSPGDLTG